MFLDLRPTTFYTRAVSTDSQQDLLTDGLVLWHWVGTSRPKGQGLVAIPGIEAETL